MKSIQVTDDRGLAHVFRSPPVRVVSAVPSDTYSIVRLGCAERLVGRTRYCVEPAGAVETIPVVGGTKDLDVERIAELQPDLVVANQEENSKRDLEALEARRLPVFISFPRTVSAGLGHLARLARVLGLERGSEPARSVVARAYGAFKEAERGKSSGSKVRVFVPIWMDPLMTANDDTFLADVLSLVGAVNVFGDRERRYPLAADLGARPALPAEKVGDRDTRYPRVTLSEVAERRPDLVLLPDEPHAFDEADAAVFRGLDTPAAHRGQVVFCNGRDLMWYGARSLEGLARLRALVDAARPSSS